MYIYIYMSLVRFMVYLLLYFCTVRAGASVPQHEGYDQPGYQPSTLRPAYEPPPPYREQPPQAAV